MNENFIIENLKDQYEVFIGRLKYYTEQKIAFEKKKEECDEILKETYLKMEQIKQAIQKLESNNG